MKLCIISNSHLSNDVRLYHKLGRSLRRFGEVYLITTKGTVNLSVNPFQIVVDSPSPLKALYHLFKEAKKHKPNIVICVEPLTMVSGLALRLSCGAKLVVDVHEFFADAHAERYSLLFRPFVKSLYLFFFRLLAAKMDGIITVNQEILNQLVPMKEQGKHCIVLPNYPVANVWDYNQERSPAMPPLCEMNFDLIYIGGISKERGAIQLLKAASVLKKDFQRLKILIVGRFENKAIEKEFNRSLDQYNLQAIIFYQPWMPAEKIGFLLKRSRFGLWLFNPNNKRLSRALPLKVLEYLAGGLPVITLKTPLMKGLIHHHKLGFLSPSFKSRDLAEAITKALNTGEEEYGRMKERCLDISRARFVWESLEPELFSLIESLQ